MRLIAIPVFALCLAAAPAFASDAAALDLKLPEAASPYGNDPPGTYYGDASGVPAPAASSRSVRRTLCPTSPDGSEAKVTGSVSTGMGYSSHMGSSTFGGASLNYCDTYTTDSGDERTINMRLDMNTYDGPGCRGPGCCPGPPRGPGGSAPGPGHYRGYPMGPRGLAPESGPGPAMRGGPR